MNTSVFYFYPEYVDGDEMTVLKIYPCELEDMHRVSPFNPFIICKLDQIKRPYTTDFIMADVNRFCNTEEEAEKLAAELLPQFKEQTAQAQSRRY